MFGNKDASGYKFSLKKTHFVTVWPKHASVNFPMRIFWVLTKDDQQFLYYILALNLHGNIYKKLNDVIRIWNLMISLRVLKDQNLIEEKAESQWIKKSFHKWLHVFPVHKHMEKIKLIKSDYSDKRNSLSSKSGITASSIDINHTDNNVIMINL